MLNVAIMCTVVVYAMPAYFALNTGMIFGAMLGASGPVFGARPHEGARREPQADHDHNVLLFVLFCGAAFKGALNTLGAATLGLCFLLFSVQLMKRWRKKKKDGQRAVLLLLHGSARGYLGISLFIPMAVWHRSSTIFSCEVMSTRPFALRRR